MGRVIHGVARVGVPDIVGFPRRYAVDEFVRTQAALGGVPIVVVQEFVPLAIGRLRVFQISRVVYRNLLPVGLASFDSC